MKLDGRDESLVAYWTRVRLLLNDTTKHKGGWYASDERADTWYKDINLCLADAAEGNKRALKYIAEFTKQRMLG
jgi:hypothetical protein